MKVKTAVITAFLLILAGAFFNETTAQKVNPPTTDHSYRPLLLPLNEDGSKYVRFIMWHQLWVTSDNMEDDTRLQLTPSIRRSRLLAYAQVSPKFLILTHFGLNGLTPANATALGNNGDGPQLFLHGAWGEIKLHDMVYIGSGLHYWNGLTRLSSQSTLNFMTLDQSRPFAAWHSLGITDQFARHLGVYAKGQVGTFDYRVAWNVPIEHPLGEGKDYGIRNSGLTYTGASHSDAAGQSTGHSLAEGYVRYQLWDRESTKLPYQVGTYLGKKKVLALGGGFYLHPNGMYDQETSTHGNVSHFALDAFLDMPVRSGDAINAYASVTNFNYGKNYVSRWAGTGQAVYAQFGYYLGGAKLMPYLAMQIADYEGLEENIQALNAGANYYINGHNCKLTLEYHHIKGDIREAAIPSSADALSQLRLQLHIFL